jgi:MFS transporter, BCD family, chlorophyll transporter
MTGLGWGSIARLGLVQSSLGAMVMLSTSLLNRIMIVEYALPALLPAGLVGWHYAVQLSRPRWGYNSDKGNRRTPWIIGGMGVLGLGSMLATYATLITQSMPVVGIGLLIVAFTMIGLGVGASGTSLLALLASRVVPDRRSAAASMTWIMMIFGIVVTAGVAGSQLDPFTPARLATVAGVVAVSAFVLTVIAVSGVESKAVEAFRDETAIPVPFNTVLREILADRQARDLTVFIFISMLAYSAQDLILEPFAGLVFGYTPGQSTQLSSMQHMGVLLGMLLVGFGGHAFGGRTGLRMRRWVIGGCIGSAGALALLAFAAITGPATPLRPVIFILGFANGVFAVAAIASMMELAGAASNGQSGARMGVWGAAQAIAFGLGGFSGAAGLDAGRAVFADTGTAFVAVFVVEAALFLVAANLARRLAGEPTRSISPTLARATA